MENERYNRQINLFGVEGQKKLANSRITVVGYNLFSEFLLSSLASLGVGNIFLLARDEELKDRYSFLNPIRRSASLEDFFHRFNSDINFYRVSSRIVNDCSTALLPPSDVVVDVTQSGVSKYHCLRYAERNNARMIMGYATNEKGVLLHNDGVKKLEDVLSCFNEKEQDSASSMIMAGLVSDEIRKIILPGEDEDKLNYNIGFEPMKPRRDERILMVGAGALGNWLGIGLALTNQIVTVIDNDNVDLTNLNRQFLFYDAVGRKKAKSLARKLSKIGGRFDYKCARLGGDVNGLENYGVFISCVDNNKTRLLMNALAYKYKKPFVNGGTDPFAGDVEVYLPRLSSCLECQNGLDEVGSEVQGNNGNNGGNSGASCITQAEDSVVISNLIVSGLMLQKVKEVMAGRVSSGKLIYSSQNGISSMEISSRKECFCYNGNEDKKDLVDDGN